MKRLIVLFLLIYNFSMAQNWAPIVSSNEYAFFSASSFSSAVIIKTDSLSAQGLDTIFYLHKIIKPIGNYKALINQGQFLQKKVISRNNGYVTFKGDSTFTLKINATLGDTWIFDSIINLTATVVQLKEDSVLGQLDSMKVISISNLDTIILSKNYGIYYYKKNNATVDYTLKGLQNLNLGYHVPKFFDFFDFNIGDVFEYRELNCLNNYSSTNGCSVRHYKITILSKTIIGNVITYIRLKQSSDTSGYSGTTYIYQSTKNDTVIYNQNNFPFLDESNHSLIKAGYCDMPPAPYGENKELLFNTSLVFNTPVKTYSNSILQNYTGDTLGVGISPWSSGATYGSKTGLIYMNCNQYGSGPGSTDLKIFLIGCIKSGIQYGTITTWTANAIGVREYINDETLNVYPTCFSSSIKIISSLKEKYDIIIVDILGRRVYSSVIVTNSSEPTEINLSFLETGHYFMRLTRVDGKEITRKIIKTE